LVAAPAPRRRLCGIALGSNLGSSESTLRRAIRALEDLLGPLRVASLYRTEPVSDIAQPDFLNTVVIARTALAAEPLLEELQAIERRFGRLRRSGDPAGGPRTLDLDLLFLGAIVRRRRAPLLPHPRMRARRFVLAPLAEIAPDLPLAPDGRSPRELLARLPERPWVRKTVPPPGGDR
jgi:2-amino-4-hydroxy-6-hydroxymethyldihydropteridine diphosphokinase